MVNLANERMTLSRYRSSSGTAGVVILAFFTLVGLVVAVFMMYVGWQHNPQGEFHDETGVHWGYWLLLGFSWFIAITGLPYAIGVGVLACRSIVRSRRV